MDAVKIIVGWFDRYPPEYYQARLDRVLAELETSPENLSLYDDAGVALDRLHRSGEAIDLMARKKEAMDDLKGKASEDTLWEHQYRHLANLGTFYVHRWIGREKEARIADLSDLAKAEELIAAAIEHNPDAHFGREKYQLLAIRWLQSIPESDDPYSWHGPIRNAYDLDARNQEEALEGFLGMIKLGAAWESPDFFKTVASLLSVESRGVLASAARLRVDELEEAGRTSLHPSGLSFEPQVYGGPDPDRRRQVEQWFPKARKAADQRQESRWAYLRKGISEGRHPDTDPDFWNGWKEPNFPPLPGQTLRSLAKSHIVITVAAISLVTLFTTLWIFSLIRRRRKKRLLESIPVVGLER